MEPKPVHVAASDDHIDILYHVLYHVCVTALSRRMTWRAQGWTPS